MIVLVVLRKNQLVCDTSTPSRQSRVGLLLPAN